MPIRKTIALVCCLICVGLGTTSFSALLRPWQSGTSGPRLLLTVNRESAKQKLEFTPGNMGEITDEDGVHLGFTVYKASDGAALTVLYEDFESSTKAAEFFKKQLTKAAKVVERKKKMNKAGQLVGERAQILERRGPQETMPAVLWINGRKFHEIRCRSLKDILELEKVY